jgi:hypothetical protein
VGLINNKGGFMKVFLGILLFLGVIVAMAFFSFGMDSFFKPAYRKLEYKTFKQSEQYNDGMVRDFENLRMEYVKAEPEAKKVIASTIKHRFSVYLENLSYEQRAFYNSL